MKTPAITNEESQMHQRNVLRRRRKSLLLWMAFLTAVACQGAGIAIALPALQQVGLTWVAALFAIAGALFVYLIGTLGKPGKLLWPATLSDVKATAKGPSRAAQKH